MQLEDYIEKRGEEWYESVKARKNSVIKYFDADVKDLIIKINEKKY